MRQCADTLLMIRPSHFGFNPETSASNTFQNTSNQPNLASIAKDEFDGMVKRLQNENIQIICFNDIPKANTPDAVFPNNWISLQHDGRAVLYPMATPNRRTERRPEILELLQDQFAFTIDEIIDITQSEKNGEFLEGTGSIVFDHINQLAFASLSQRTSSNVLNALCQKLDYEPISFESKLYDNTAVYHTNVLLSIGERHAVVCLNAIAEGKSKAKMIEMLELSNRELIEISEEQMFHFGANLLEVRNGHGDPFIACSETAVDKFSKEQIRKLENHATLLPCSVPNIEKHGGGSVRCMLAEVFLPKSSQETIVVAAKSQQELESCFQLRHEILRRPWNQPIGSERDEQEASSWHFLAKNAQGSTIGTVRLQRLDEQRGQLRYMAVAEKNQGKGIGKQLLKAAEKQATALGMKSIFLQARDNAVPFYLANGYQVLEKTFLLYDEIQHYSMEKHLSHTL
ncbi:MAG: citrulline utilization hydrolase CtlX [Bacteroidota bacterium]